MRGSELRPLTAAGGATLESNRLSAMHVKLDCSGELPPPNLFDGTYELTSLMGQGSMGEVWRARNVNLDKEVAIKLVKLEGGDPSADVRLRNEARLAAKMNHPNVVGVYDAGVAGDGRYYLVMELLEGHDLRQILDRQQTLPAVEAVQILLPVLAGLDCAHRRSIVHRDIKPDNIFLASSEGSTVPKLVDFGIALGRDLPSAVRTTRTGVFLGTPLYMAPEQVAGALDLDERADIWAVATVLYELISGRVPFASDELRVLFSSITCAEVPPIDESLCDAELAAILMRGLAKNPKERWSSARDMARALVAWLTARGVTEDVSGDSLEKTWISGTLRRTGLGSLPPSAGAPFKVSPRALNTAGSASARHSFSKLSWSLALGASSLLIGALLVFSGMRPDRLVDVEPVLAVTAPGYTSPAPVDLKIPASVPETAKRESPPQPAPSAEQSVREVSASEKLERSAQGARRPAVARDAAKDVAEPPAPAPSAPVAEVRRPQVDPTWGF